MQKNEIFIIVAIAVFITMVTGRPQIPFSVQNPAGMQSAWANPAAALAEAAAVMPATTLTTITIVPAVAPEKNVDYLLSLMTRAKKNALDLLSRFGVDAEVAKLYAKWIIGAPALVLFILVLMLLRPRRKRSRLKTRSIVSRPIGQVLRPARPVTSGKPKGPTGQGTDTGEVLQFFLRLFKHQQNLEPDATAQVYLIEHRSYCPHDTYEMRAQFRKEWITRRMSVGLLGQGGGSRSRCFYVIYDSHLVIKIPAEPVTDFSAYNRQIAAEARIVARLAPRQCIVPRVGVILKTVYPTIDEASSEDSSEEEYIRLLESKPAYQEYLKLGGSFAFFMDLAKYFFLSATLEEIHRGNRRLLDEVTAYPDLFWDHNNFVGRYGEEAGAVCHELQDAYRQCENQLRHLIDEAHILEEVPSYVFKQWFLHHLAGERIDIDETDLQHDIIDQADQIIDKILQSHQEQVKGYRKGLNDYIGGVRFSRHRRQLENLSSNTLDLLAWIMEKGLALRDLKPENLFVAGNPKDYPIFLNDPANFSIGLIDVETAVVLDGVDPDHIPQPQLAGTPLYATPTHLLSNAVLSEIFGDVRTTLQLQDWHATIAILFKLITGENLFTDTAHVFPEIVNEIKIMDPVGLDMEDQVIKISRLFWNSATAEFQEAMQAHKTTFAQVKIKVPEVIAPSIQSILAKELNEMGTTMTDLIAGQSFFSSEEKLRFLSEASAKKISQMKNRLVQERDRGDEHGRHRGGALIFFKQLDRLKRDLQRSKEALVALDSPMPDIDSDLLLNAMFHWVYHHMYPSHWPALAPTRFQATAYMTTDITTYQATL